MNNNYKYDPIKMTPFKWFVLENFPFLEEDFDSLTSYGLWCKLKQYFDKVAHNVNEMGLEVQKLSKAFSELENYVDNYFKNLDVQAEINNKLDEMVEDGTLQEIIADYLNSKAIFAFDTVNDMVNATNLINGSYAKTLGFYSINDGGGALYKIRTIENTDDTTYNAIIPMESDNTLVAEIVNYNTYNVLQYGINTSTIDCSPIVQKIIDNAPSGSTIIFPPQTLNFNTSLNLINNQKLHFKGTRTNNYNQSGVSKLVFNGVNGFTSCSWTTFEDLEINGVDKTGHGLTGTGIKLYNCQISNFNVAINTNYHIIHVERCDINRNNTGILNPVDSRIINNTINANSQNGITIQSGSNDNIISNNKIEWNDGIGVSIYQGVHNVVSDNIFDRNGTTGLKVSTSSRNIITNNLFRRNGVYNGVSANYPNILLENVQKSIVSNNNTMTGNSEDDGTGFTCPGYAIYLNGCSNMMLIGNDFTGGTANNPINEYNNGENLSLLDVTNPPIQLLRTLTSGKGVNANGGTNTYNIPLDTPIANALPKYKRLVATWRADDESNYGIKEFYIYTYVQYGSIKVALSETSLKTDLSMSVAYDSTNGYVITITNNTSKKQNVKIDRFDL